MDLSNVAIVFSACLGVLSSLIGVYLNGKLVSKRLKLEKQLTANLAQIISDERLEVQLKLAAGQLEISATFSTDEEIGEERAREEVKEKITAALSEMSDEDKELIMSTINQSSKKGQSHYIRKLANRTLDTLEAKSA
ncbi:hypothetical protein [Vibrio chagasii]|uniref:hypothetical protein n=1 Tax=Vibrio chagasii TaxID=170679 RepID=UPI003BFA5504